MYVGNALAVAVSLPMVANATNETPSASPAITAQAAQADGMQILRINPTTVELCFANHRRVAVDFYGENIFRIFEDHNGGVMRDPEAKPEAHILVDNHAPRWAACRLLSRAMKSPSPAARQRLSSTRLPDCSRS